jgi:L-rhamnose mutarotase
MSRIVFTRQIDPAKQATYQAAHAALWPDMLQTLADAGGRDYRSFLRPDGLPVGTLQTDNPTAAQQATPGAAVNARRQAAMAAFLPSLRDARPDEDMVVLDEILHLETQLDVARHGSPPPPVAR